MSDMDKQKRELLEARLHGMPVPLNSTPSREGYSNLSEAASRDREARDIQLNAWKELGTTNNSLPGGQQGQHDQENENAQKLQLLQQQTGSGSGSRKRALPSTTNMSVPDGHADLMKSPRESPLKPQDGKRQQPGDADTSRDGGVESDTESRGAKGMRPIASYFGGGGGGGGGVGGEAMFNGSGQDGGSAAMAMTAEAAINGATGGNGMTAAQAQSMLGGGGGGKEAAGAAASKKLSKTKVKVVPSTKGKAVGVAAGVGSSSSGESSGAIAKQLESARVENERLELKIKRMESDAKQGDDAKLALDEENDALRRSLESVQRLAAIRESRHRRDRLASDCVRLGKIVTQRVTNNTVADVWEEGYALKEMQKRQGSLLQRKEDLENRRKAIQMNKKKAARRAAKTDDGPPDFDMDFATEEAAIRMHLDSLQRDQQSLAEEKRLLEEEKASHTREFKRIMHEDRSRFVKSLPLLNRRYLMQMLLGRGGFSEVWKAYDLNERKEVAVKVHQLNPTWSQDRKNSYIRHVTREYKIHCDMNHPRVVRQFDVFEIDENSFATVLEYCRGTDLDEKLKREKILPEKIAKTILMQMLSGVRYLHTPSPETGGRKTVIHYDLKPANILFDERGDVKITDFGLSKMVDESNEGTSMELTSQGAGTYYYLPPECFAKVDAKVSTKVDVWSLGVIYYQMLVGRKPFGEGKSQERILADGIMLSANRDKLHFPDCSDLSEEGKSFIRDCLTSDYKLRPDITELCSSPYICGKSKK